MVLGGGNKRSGPTNKSGAAGKHNLMKGGKSLKLKTNAKGTNKALERSKKIKKTKKGGKTLDASKKAKRTVTDKNGKKVTGKGKKNESKDLMALDKELDTYWIKQGDTEKV